MKYFNKKGMMIIMLLSCFIIVNAQGEKKKKNSSSVDGEKCFNGSSHIINLGVGLGNSNYYRAYRGYGYSYKTSPAFSVSYEQAIPKKLGPGFLGLGAYLGYQQTSSTYNYYWDKHGYNNNYYYKNSWSNFMIAVRGAYHLDFLNFKKGEVYFGTLAGLRFQTYNYETNNPDPNANNYRLNSGSVFPTVSVFAGARWYFVNNVAFFAEAGYGISFLTGGISFKF